MEQSSHFHTGHLTKNIGGWLHISLRFAPCAVEIHEIITILNIFETILPPDFKLKHYRCCNWEEWRMEASCHLLDRFCSLRTSPRSSSSGCQPAVLLEPSSQEPPC